jgi:hypothetical protein
MHGSTTLGILAHFTFFIAYLPYNHHMSVTPDVANMQSAKQVWQMCNSPQLAGKQ